MRFSFCAPLSVGAPNPGRPQKVSHCWKCCLWSSSSACLRFWVWSFLGCRTRFGHSNTFYTHYFFTIYCVPSLKYCNGVELPLAIIVSIKSVGKRRKMRFCDPTWCALDPSTLTSIAGPLTERDWASRTWKSNEMSVESGIFLLIQVFLNHFIFSNASHDCIFFSHPYAFSGQDK